MKTITWDIDTGVAQHQLEMKHAAFWSGRASLTIDQFVVYERKRKLFDKGLEHRFTLDGKPCLLRIRYLLGRYEYELFVDGKLH